VAPVGAPVPDAEDASGVPVVPARRLRLFELVLGAFVGDHRDDVDDAVDDHLRGRDDVDGDDGIRTYARTGAEAGGDSVAKTGNKTCARVGPRARTGHDCPGSASASRDDAARRSASAACDDDHGPNRAVGCPVVGDELLSIDEAIDLVLAHVAALPAEDVPIAEAAGRVPAEVARSAVDLPPFPSSAMDGFAVRAADTPGTLPVVARVAAGRPAPRPLAAGEAMAISTGAVVPDGADSVVPIEVVDEQDDNVVIHDNVIHGDNVRERGGDLRAGEAVVEPGVRLGPAHVGALAAAGVTSVRCARVPRVAVAVTGTELRSPGETLEPGQIYDANGFIVAAQLASVGALVERLPAVADDEAVTRAAIERGLEADVLVTTGGVSVGVYDFVRAAEVALGVEEIFWRVAMQPGKPVAFGVRGRTLVFGLPGNPVSSLVGFELFVRPALLALQGVASPRPPFRPGRLAAPARRLAARDALLRARTRVEGDAVLLEPLTGQQSHMIAAAATADALVLVPQGDGELAAGSPVSYLPL